MKLGKVEFCHFLQLIALFLCFSGMSQAELSRSGSKPYFQSGRSRTKRSWVWNQFFVLEEYMGSDPLYVGKVGYLAFPSHKRFLWMSGWMENGSFFFGDEKHKAVMRFLALVSHAGTVIQVLLIPWSHSLGNDALFQDTGETRTHASFSMMVAC